MTNSQIFNYDSGDRVLRGVICFDYIPDFSRTAMARVEVFHTVKSECIALSNNFDEVRFEILVDMFEKLELTEAWFKMARKFYPDFCY